MKQMNHMITFGMALAAIASLPFGPRIMFDMEGRSGGGLPSAEEMARQIKSDFAKATDAVKEIAEKALAEANAGKGMAEGIKEKADEALLKMNEMKAQVDALEQKAARGGGNGAETKSIGEQFVESESYKSFAANKFSRSGKADMQVKATLTTVTSDTDGAVGDGIRSNRLPGILERPLRRLTVRDLLMPGTTDSPSIEYVKETGFNNNAAPVAEGAAKPSSDIKLDLVATSTKVIAHWFKASRQVLSDVAQLRSLIDARLINGLKLVEENQLLNGDGTGQNLLGIIPQATAYAAPSGITTGSDTAIDKIRFAMLQAVLAEFPASATILNPIDWARIETTKDTTGNYIIGNPQGTLSPTLWNLPVVATQAITVDKFLTGSFDTAAQIFDQWESRVETGFVNDDFIKNLVTILGEERLAFAVYRPESFIHGDLGYIA